MDGQTAVENDYEILERLGEGAFAMVFKARHKKTSDIVAVKQIKLGTKSWHEACRSTELQALRSLRHPFIVRLRELIRSQLDGSLYYILEFVDSDLCHLVKQNPHGLEESRAAELARQLFAGLAHMHQHNFFHRDIKPENLLLDTASLSLRIADFGQARGLRAPPPFTDYVGTRWYRAPECLLRDRGYSSPVDVWAGALVLAELLRGSPVFCGTSSVDQLYKIFQVLGQPDNDWPEFGRLAEAMRFRVPEVSGCGVERVIPRATPDAHALVADVLVLSPRCRPLARKCLEHGFFAKLPALDLGDTARSRPSVAGGHHSMSPERSYSRVESHRSLAPPASDRTWQPSTTSLGNAECSLELEASLGIAESSPEVDLDAELDKILGEALLDGSPKLQHGSGKAAQPVSPPLLPDTAGPEMLGQEVQATELDMILSEQLSGTPGLRPAPGAPGQGRGAGGLGGLGWG